MPRTTAITYDNFFHKAEAMQELYGRVTYEKMRDVLGSGSMSTIKPMMHRWRRERQAKTSLGVPKALSERIDIVVRDVYEQIASLAEERKEKLVAEATQAMENERYRADRADTHALESQTALKKVRSRLAARERTVAELKSELMTVQGSLARSEAKLESANQRIADLTGAQGELNRDLVEAQNQIALAETAGSGSAQLTERLKHRTQMLAETRQRLRDAEAHVEKLELELSEARKVNGELSHSFSELVKR